MTIPIGGGKLNLNPCTQDDELRNLEVINNKFEQLDQVIEAGGLPDHKVAVNATDEGGGGADYLHAKLKDHGTYVSDYCVKVRAETIGDATEQLYLDAANDILNGDSGGTTVLTLSAGILSWLEFTDTIDNYTVKVTSGDSTASFLHDAFNLNASYFENADLLVGTETVGDPLTDQTERLFVDVSAIDGWNGTDLLFLGIEANISSYYTITAIGIALIDDSTFTDAILDLIDGGGGGGSGIAKYGVLDENIAPRLGTTAHHATVSIWTIDPDTGEMTDTGDDEEWWNISAQGGTAGDFVQSKRDATSGLMLFDWEDCVLSL